MKRIIALVFILATLTSCGLIKKNRPADLEFRAATLSVTAQNKCIDTLGAAKYPGVLRAIPNDICIGAFARTFGDFFPVARSELAAGRACMRINLIWSDSHAYGDKDLKFVQSESKRYNALCAQYPDRKIEIAPFTEHKLARPDKYLEAVRANAPNCSFAVNTPWTGAYTSNSQFKNEIHGTHGKPNIQGVSWNFSHDGTNSVDRDIKKDLSTYSGASTFCVWHPRLNLKWSMADTTPRPERKAKPTADFLRSLAYLFTPKGPVSLPPKWIVKSHSENHGPDPVTGAPDSKGDKLLIISPVKVTYKENGKTKVRPIILKRGGLEIGRLTYYGSFQGGGWRYYAPQMGYKYGPNAEVWIHTKNYGVINGGFRAGTFRP